MMTQATEQYQRSAQRFERDQLVLEHRGLVRHVLSRLLTELPEHVDRENLEGAGLLGLVEAAARYDASRGVEFGSFASLRIRGAILDELRRNCPLPQQQLELWARIREATANSLQYPTREELAVLLNVEPEAIDECLEGARMLRHEEWLDELAPCSRTPEVDQPFEEEDRQRRLTDAITQLPERLPMVVVLYYTEDLRLKEIGEVLGLSESRVSRLLGQAHLRLKHLLTVTSETGNVR